MCLQNGDELFLILLRKIKQKKGVMADFYMGVGVGVVLATLGVFCSYVIPPYIDNMLKGSKQNEGSREIQDMLQRMKYSEGPCDIRDATRK